MSTSSGDPGDQNPTIPGGVETMGLRQLHIRILKLMLLFHELRFTIFHRFVQEHGLPHISQEKLLSAVLFLEESFDKTVKEQGKNPHFLNPYLEQRFRLSKQIRGPLGDDHDQENVNDDQEDADNDNQDFMDIAILKSIVNFYLVCGGVFPEADSNELYDLLVREFNGNIRQDELVERILILEENLKKKKSGGATEPFRNPRHAEIHKLSNWIWGDGQDQDDQIQNPGGVVKISLRQQYIYILKFIHQSGLGSDGFYQAAKDGLPLQESQENLRSIIAFMEEAFHKTVKEKGINAHFLNSYLEERFQLSKKIWDPPPRNVGERYDYVVDPEKQDFMDLAILKSIFNFYFNSGVLPEPDSDEFYNLVRGSIHNIRQDELVDRILFMEERICNINTRKMLEDLRIGFQYPRQKEIYELSNLIWGDPKELFAEIRVAQSNDELQEIIQVAILRCMVSFIRSNGYIPAFDNIQFYNYVRQLKIDITQQKLVDTLNFLEWMFQVNQRRGSVARLPNVRQRLMHYFSTMIWGSTAQIH